MHKDGKWAKQIIAQQDDEGKWGWFHSLSQIYDSPITTEQALRRLERLGYTMEDECIRKAVSYMEDCLTGKKAIPDRREKLHDWDIFSSLILSTWIRRFTPHSDHANRIAQKWAAIITRAFQSGFYDHKEYAAAFRDIWGIMPKGGRFLDFVSFYSISLIENCLDKKTEHALLDYVINKEDGIYYIYDKNLSQLPACFQSREASRYLGAIELLAEYRFSPEKLTFAAEWLMDNRGNNEMWDMGKVSNDRVYFPLSDDWRRKEIREADCTERIQALLTKLSHKP